MFLPKEGTSYRVEVPPENVRGELESPSWERWVVIADEQAQLTYDHQTLMGLVMEPVHIQVGDLTERGGVPGKVYTYRDRDGEHSVIPVINQTPLFLSNIALNPLRGYADRQWRSDSATAILAYWKTMWEKMLEPESCGGCGLREEMEKMGPVRRIRWLPKPSTDSSRPAYVAVVWSDQMVDPMCRSLQEALRSLKDDSMRAEVVRLPDCWNAHAGMDPETAVVFSQSHHAGRYCVQKPRETYSGIDVSKSCAWTRGVWGLTFHLGASVLIRP